MTKEVCVRVECNLRARRIVIMTTHVGNHVGKVRLPFCAKHAAEMLSAFPDEPA
jgi:hypothetical protein